MNSSQKGVIVGAILAITLMGLVPPWTYYSPMRQSSSHVGYWWLFSQKSLGYNSLQVANFQGGGGLNAGYRPSDAESIDVTLLLCQWTGVVLVAGGLFVLLGGQKDPEKHQGAT